MSAYSCTLNKEEWSAHYNIKILNGVINQIETNSVSVWSEELSKICGAKPLK